MSYQKGCGHDRVRMRLELASDEVRKIMSYWKGCGLPELAQCTCVVYIMHQ